MAGAMDKAKGRAKKAIGDLSDDDRMRDEGRLDEGKGKVKDAVDRAGDWVEDRMRDARD